MDTQNEGRFEQIFTVNGPVKLDLETHSGTMRVSTGEEGTVRIRGIIRGSSFFGFGSSENEIQKVVARPPVAQRGNEIWVERVDGLNLLLDIVVPRETSVRGKCESGGFRIEGVRGAVRCSTNSGYVELMDIGGGGVRCETESGRIEMRQVTGPIYAHVESGDIQALEIAGEIEAKAESGDIRVTQTTPGRIRLKTESGRVRVQLAPDAGYSVRARADSGNIHAPGLPPPTALRNEVVGELRGGGTPVSVEAESGDIDIE